MTFTGGVTPPVLPCLHGLVPDRFNNSSDHHTMDVQEEIEAVRDFQSDNTECLGELLLGFLHYYSCFDYAHSAISVRAGCRLPIDECRFAKAPKNDPGQWKYMCIEEPFDLTNTGKRYHGVLVMTVKLKNNNGTLEVTLDLISTFILHSKMRIP